MALILPPNIGREFAFDCLVCGKSFYENEFRAYVSHTTACAENHADKIDAIRAEKRKWNQPVDPEWEKYNRTLEAMGIDPMKQYERKGKRSPKRSLLES